MEKKKKMKLINTSIDQDFAVFFSSFVHLQVLLIDSRPSECNSHCIECAASSGLNEDCRVSHLDVTVLCVCCWNGMCNRRVPLRKPQPKRSEYANSCLLKRWSGHIEVWSNGFCSDHLPVGCWSSKLWMIRHGSPWLRRRVSYNRWAHKQGNFVTTYIIILIVTCKTCRLDRMAGSR